MNTATKIGIAVLGTSLSLAATAASFNVEIEIESLTGDTPLTITEQAAMAFPTITIDESSTENTVCVANDSSYTNKYINGDRWDGLHNSSTSLCAGATVPRSKVQVNGTPNAMVTLDIVTAEQTQGGFEFTGTNSSESKKLNGAGIYDTGLTATLRLVDKSAVSSGLLTFNYDVTAAYQ